MNKKIMVGIAIALIIIAVGMIGIKAMLGDEATELPYEEQTEKTLNLQEKTNDIEMNEQEEAGEIAP